MTVMPKVEEDRFGSPLDVLKTLEWEDFAKRGNVFECRALLCPEPEGGYSAHALRLLGVVSQGESVEEALANLKDAFRETLRSYSEDNEEIPWSDDDIETNRPAGSIEKWILVNV